MEIVRRVRVTTRLHRPRACPEANAATMANAPVVPVPLQVQVDLVLQLVPVDPVRAHRVPAHPVRAHRVPPAAPVPETVLPRA
ncbi:hypothetical protein AAU01_25220 [Paenarthrobacter aurescens]|uniref:Uncharacterized protein n=1 Tax=Paenarthrobacter aurescens TaxID=43663 RepID=A0A4Y3NFA1_PAEAU|nr:hypothetical protein AAU01_25220 [Paenarthrobacter aurescens]